MAGLAIEKDERIAAIYFADGRPNPIGRLVNVVVMANGLYGGVEFSDSALADEVSAKWGNLDKSKWAIDVSLIETENVFAGQKYGDFEGPI